MVIDVYKRQVECIILSVNDTYMDAQEVMHLSLIHISNSFDCVVGMEYIGIRDNIL